jgi:hypothetical protein
MFKTMYETMSKYTIEHLTKHEITKLKKMVLGYGNFTRTADMAQLPKPTLRDLIHRGYGTPKTIEKVRSVLSEAA